MMHFKKGSTALIKLTVLLLLVITTSLWALDSDSDGVPDEFDNYPTDSTKVVDLPAALEAVSANISLWLTADGGPDIPIPSVSTENDASVVRVTTWYDWSGNQQHCDKTTTGPLYKTDSAYGPNGISIDFNSVANIMVSQKPTVNIEWVFIAFKFNSWKFANYFICHNDGTTSYDYALRVFELKQSAANFADWQEEREYNHYLDGVVFESPHPTVNVSVPHLWTSQRNTTLRVSSLKYQLSSSASFGGDQRYLDAEMFEVIGIKSGANLTEDQIAAIELYLNQKWGINPDDDDLDGVVDAIDEYPEDKQKVVDFPAAFDGVTSNLVAWFDASVIEAVSVDGSNNTSIWYDRSGHRNHAYQTTSGKEPVFTLNSQNGLPSLVFDGTNDTIAMHTFAGGNLVQPGTIFFVGDPDDANGRVAYGSIEKNSLRWVYMLFTDEYVHYYAGGLGEIYTETRHVNPHISTAIFDGSSSTTYTNGQSHGAITFSNVALKGLSIGSMGGTEYYDGKISEILVFNKALSDSERASVVLYLSDKWGIEGIDADDDGVPTPNDLYDSDPSKVTDLPTEIQAVSANLAAWYNGNSTTANNRDGSDLVDTLYDLSGHQYHLTSTSASRPLYSATALNNRPALVFNDDKLDLGSTTLYTPSSKTGVTIIAAVQPSGNSANLAGDVVFNYGGYSGQGYGFGAGTSMLGYFTPVTYGGVSQMYTSGVNFSGPMILSMVIKFNEYQKLFVNGVEFLSDSITVTALDNTTVAHSASAGSEQGPLTIGHESEDTSGESRHFVGAIGDVLIFQEALSDTDRLAIELYLKQKYNYGQTVYVDQSSATYSDGSLSSPFKTLSNGVDGAITGGTVILKSNLSGVTNYSTTKNVIITTDGSSRNVGQ